MPYDLIQRRGKLSEADRAPPAQRSRRRLQPDAEALRLVPASVCWDHTVLPLSVSGERLTVAAVDVHDIALADRLRFLTAREVVLVPASASDIHAALARHVEPDDDEMCYRSVEDIELADSSLCETMFQAGASTLGARRSRKADPTEAHEELRSPPRSKRVTAGGRVMNRQGIFFHTVDEGQQVLMTRRDGTKEVLCGPRRVWIGGSRFERMSRHVAHPGQFLLIRYCDGRQEHLEGPAEIWLDPRLHLSIDCQDSLQLSGKEAVVVYSRDEKKGGTGRHIVYGPGQFVPQPGQWLHKFSWHASQGGSRGEPKVPNALVFHKLWLMPDQMYHDVPDVRTADDALLTIRLMVFFELVDIETMLDATHDPIGDMINAATADVVEFTGRHDFERFKQSTEKLNQLETYRQLQHRASQCGYRINNVVYRGYGAADSLQQMHNQAIEARTRLQLDRDTEQQAQELENYKLDCQLARSQKRRSEQADEVRHELGLNEEKQESQLRQRRARDQYAGQHRQAAAQQEAEIRAQQDAQSQTHLAALKGLGVDLTAFLTQSRADRVIELRGGAGAQPHLHVEPQPAGHNGET